MADDFDPYFQWLNIPPSEQPPNHYRLLSLARFESDRDHIEKSVAKLVARLQTLSSGEHVEHAQRILNDVAKARLCLGDPTQKQKYDEALRESLGLNRSAVKPSPPQRRLPDSKSPAETRERRPAASKRDSSRKSDKEKAIQRRKVVNRKSSRLRPNRTVRLLLIYGAVLLVISAAALAFLVTQYSTPVATPEAPESVEARGLELNASWGSPLKLRPEETGRLSEVHGKQVEVVGVVTNVAYSRSGKTCYLGFGFEFKKNWQIAIEVAAQSQKFSKPTLDAMVGKRIQATGVARYKSRSGRYIVKLQDDNGLSVLD